MRKNLFSTTFILFLTMLLFSCNSSTKTEGPGPVSSSNSITKDTNWKVSDNKVVDGLMYVESGATLTIEAGAVIKFKKKPTNGDPSSALIIARGAIIMAEGTQDNPIIFTAEADNPNVAGEELSKTATGEWGGIIILGKAPVIKKGVTTLNVEGISSSEERAKYGGTVANDNSGVLKYVSIRYTGIALNGESGNEIQGLTLAGVGSGTIIDYVDIYVSGDDGVEIFGGTVDLKHVSVSFAKDDSFDFDQGYRGKAQFLFSIHDDRADGSDNVAEWDGAGNATDNPFSAPIVANWTAIGAGSGATSNGGSQALTMREWFAGKIYNSLFEGFKGKAVRVEDLKDTVEDSYGYITTARNNYQLEIKNNLFADFGGYNSNVASLALGYKVNDEWTGDTTALEAELTDNNNKYKSSALTSISRSNNAMLDPKPTTTALTDVTTDTVSGLEETTYVGAFAPTGDAWIKGWTSLEKFGYLK